MSDLLLLANALRDTFRPRRLIIALILLLLPPVLAVGWRLLSPRGAFVPGDVYDSLVSPFVFSVSLTILSVVYGTGVVSQEIEGKTIVYLLTRPFPRWRILLAKFTAAFLTVGTVTTVSVLLVGLALYEPSRLAEAGMEADIVALWMGALTYGGVFLLLGTALPRPLTYGLMFVFGWETVVPKLPGEFARVSIMTYLKVISAREITENPAQSGGGNPLLAFAQAPNLEIPVPDAWRILIAVAVVTLIAAHVLFSVREYIPRDDSE
ncbi:MAG: ABC transporter permease [Capsulimonadales bacterium]|nr:ABC transporter permease [Capsulimonadales bacterium]